jgi:putative hydrolase of the HAD superfamily
MPYSELFFDLDDTLYSKTNGLWEAIAERMMDFMQERLGFPPEEIPELRRKYYETYGTTLRGLQINHAVDADEYLAYVHDLPLEDYLSPDPDLRGLMESLPQPKWIFTNSDASHANRVLEILDLKDCFKGIIDVRALGFLCKPDQRAYRRALSLVNGVTPEDCVLFDDSLRNLESAFSLGFTTVLVGTVEVHPAADYSVQSLKDLAQIFPKLWSDHGVI